MGPSSEAGTSIFLSPRRKTMAPVIPRGFRPIPISEVVVKVYERCNLACDYCYMYELEDQTWMDNPNSMSHEVFGQLSLRIAEHARRHRLESVSVVFHGGEPLLRGKDFFQFAVERLRRDVPADTAIEYRLQTNGTLLTEQFLRLLQGLDIRVGVSLDGGRQENDLHRRYRNGDSSYDRVVRGIELLTRDEFRPSFSRLYCTIDLANDPIATYEGLAQFDPPIVDFLLPHANWDTPPPRLDPNADDAPYADWLIPIFDRWFDSERPPTTIRYFAEIINMLLGGQSHLESIGLSPAALVVIETDGKIEQTDSLRSAFHGATQTGRNVFEHSFDDLLELPEITFRQIGSSALCDTCNACTRRDVCGAGYLPHRYRTDNGFDNPSIYCRDLLKLIDHIDTRLRAELDRHPSSPH